MRSFRLPPMLARMDPDVVECPGPCDNWVDRRQFASNQPIICDDCDRRYHGHICPTCGNRYR